MSTTPFSSTLPDPDQIRDRIEAGEQEIKALRKLLRASLAAVRADEARARVESVERGDGIDRADD
jgi:hypothetical protein